jgi:DNA-directed RNA polymerase subunit RPC12/RpoP
LKCPHCGKEISDEDATFCPYCGEPIESRPKSSDIVLAAAILTIVAAAFSAGSGYGALNQYATLAPLYDFSLISDYLIVGIIDIITFVIAIAGAILMLKRKIIIVSIIGAVIPLAAVFSPYLVVPQYQYGIVEVAIIIFAILSTIFVIASRDEFVKPSVTESV